MPSAKLSLHLMPVVFVMTTARRTRSQCVHPTRQHLRTSAFVCWTFAGARVTTLSIIPVVAQVRERIIRIFKTTLTSVCRPLVLWDMVPLMTYNITQFGGHLACHLGITVLSTCHFPWCCRSKVNHDWILFCLFCYCFERNKVPIIQCHYMIVWLFNQLLI